ncbi:toxin [Enterococcus florum]|uniref:Toxin n=1 Tax=Enterococcus florum TaxID=2480627 RepID=A0A4P5P3X0_9ENTE|nr:ImmA/IrrE family metallo-endopeptidase [Enterococcus florum]GCF92465.1 toxin [Enterococcus florum]
MQLDEKLMSDYPELSFISDPLMPKKQKGWIFNKTVYLNPRQSYEEKCGTIAEEIGHYLTSVGDIIHQDTNEKRQQEQKARDVGYTLAVTPQDLINCYHERFDNVWECAEFLGVTKDTLENAVKTYSKKYEFGLKFKNYKIDFRPNGTVGVYEFFDE